MAPFVYRKLQKMALQDSSAAVGSLLVQLHEQMEVERRSDPWEFGKSLKPQR